MFAKAETNQDAIKYLYNIQKYYKIWYSLNPDIFLGLENQLRFVRMRHDNPHAELFFIYSRDCLTVDANKSLESFCELYSIIPVAVEDLQSLLRDEKDIYLYTLLKVEIARAANNTGGNMAAASDITRHLKYVIENYNIYSDFELGLKLSQIAGGEYYIKLPSCILFNAELTPLKPGTVHLSPNTDFLAFGFDEQNPNVLTAEALNAISNVQELIIDNYKLPFSWEKLFPAVTAKELLVYPQMPEVINEFHRRYPDNPTVFDFRIYLTSLPSHKREPRQPENLNSFLTRHSVINLTGPGTSHAYFKHFMPKKCNIMPLLIPSNDKDWRPFLVAYEKGSIGFYDPIYDLIATNNRISAIATITKKEDLCDQSWTKEGADRIQKREEQMLNAAISLQKTCRRHMLWKKYPDESLYVNIKAICKLPSIRTPIREKNYPLALRRACSELKLPIVRLMLEYRKNDRLVFDVNEPSSTNGFTALDWALQAKLTKHINQKTKEEVIQLLKDAGAKCAQEMKLTVTPF